MVKKIAFTLSIGLICASSANAQSSALPAEITTLQDTQLYLGDISSIGIEQSSDNIKHSIVGKATHADSRCGIPGSRCVGLPAPSAATLIVNENVSVPQSSSLAVFGTCRRAIESAKPTDKFVLRGDFERWQYRTTGLVNSRPELRVKRLVSCFIYRFNPQDGPVTTTK
jgi:hypothetical protein